MLASGLSLHERLLKYLERQSVALDVHLCSSKTIYGTSGLEVHIAEVVLISKDVAQHGILLLSRILDKTHSYTADRLLHRHTCVHKGESTGTNGSH